MSIRSGHHATTLVGIVVLLFLALLARTGADLWWLAAWGDHALDAGALPERVPFAAAESHWHPVPALAAFVLAGVAAGGTPAMLVLHCSLVVAAMVLSAVAAKREGAGDMATAAVVALVVIGGAASLAVARLQSFSLLFLVVLLIVIRSEAAAPTRRIWWAPAIVVLWGNLHGAVLLGVCVLGAYLLVGRLRERPLETIGVGLASMAGLCLTPALWQTPQYYLSVFDNASAQQHIGLWARLSVSEPFDAVFIGCAVALIVSGVRRFATWEYVAGLGLLVATVLAARNSIWLLLFLFVPAALGASRSPAKQQPRVGGRLPGIALVLAGCLCLASLVWRGLSVDQERERLVDQVRQAVGSGVVLAPGQEAEVLAAHGIRQWVVNPLDAFTAEDQRSFLAFLEHGRVDDRARAGADAVLTRAEDMEATGLPSSWKVTRLVSGWILVTKPQVDRDSP